MFEKESSDNENKTSIHSHNENCYAYLKYLMAHTDNFVIVAIQELEDKPKEKPPQFPRQLAENLQLIKNSQNFQDNEKHNKIDSYSKIYNEFFTIIEANVGKIIENLEEKNKESFNKFLDAIYANDSKILEKTDNYIQRITTLQRPTSPSIEKTIAKKMDDKNTKSDVIGPVKAGSLTGRLKQTFSDELKTQHTTSISTVRRYEYNEDLPLTEYRFGTQAQRHAGEERVSPLFVHWLKLQHEKNLNENINKKKNPITHIYFNNLGVDFEGMGALDKFERQKEARMSGVLNMLEDEHPNISVITLPADKGLLSASHIERTHDKHDYEAVKQEFINIAMENGLAQNRIRDFHISTDRRKAIFDEAAFKELLKPQENIDKLKQEQYEQAIIQHLLEQCFQDMGFTSKDPLSSAQRQAVWFHFNKFVLPEYIIQKLNPKSINFSCKDAIDRGGVSSAYYNLLQSFKTNTPLSREEFDRALQAAPTMVKARGMNHHIKLIWNAVDVYVNAKYDQLRKDPSKAWLIEWRDMNCPHTRVEELLEKRIAQINEKIKPQVFGNKIYSAVTEIMKEVDKQFKAGVSGKRLLIETVSRLDTLLTHPKKDQREAFEVLANDLEINYPRLRVLGGLMKAFVGVLLYLPSIGHTSGLITKGLATMKSGFTEASATRARMVTELRKLHQPESESEKKDDFGNK